MTAIPFYKYQGTGNDFVIIDNRQHIFSKKDAKIIAQLCDRKFGIGADGLMLLENHADLDFTMVYYNADGQPSSMCGNGGRCLVSFARYLGLVQDRARFEAVDGIHEAILYDNGHVGLQMSNVPVIQVFDGHIFTDTGSPHHVQLTDNIEHTDVVGIGRKLRRERYGAAGANINFVEPQGGNVFKVRTYERGVEDETLSCGTGVTAVALAMHRTQHTQSHEVILHTPGGELAVKFQPSPEGYQDIWLTGPAVQVFKGSIDL
ncbi:diaminopimelate epimerase [Nonlabens xiamenensis]|uniref:diaminopimelate epimerase n=1 Tax=Nonlabens xiamenensis TaxID=2341043 RepID=UPI000F60C3E6|nr:diaminopimelate epimerase [Nonlabens xiamenensis]